ncbi:MAG: hypothetical protein AAF415_13750 [Pseudomonadota bacterium]
MRHTFTCAVALATALGLAPGAQAQTVESGATLVGPNGKTTTVERSLTRGGGQAQGKVRVNWDGGRGYTRSFNQTRQNGVISRQGTLTTNSGKVFQRDAQRSCSGGACSGSSVVTGPRGEQWSRERSLQRVGPGQWEGQVTRTGPRGRQTTGKRWFRIDRRR